MAEVIYVDSREKAIECYNAVKANPGLLYFDTETTGLLVRSGTQDQVRLIQLSVRPWDKAWAFDARTDEWQDAIRACFDVAESIAAHNLKFDIHVLYNYGIDLWEAFHANQMWDTTWIAHFHDENDSRKLKDLGVKYLRIDAAAEQAKLKRLMKKEGWDWETVPLKHLVNYGGMDTIIGGELYDLLMPRIEGWAMEPLRREQRLNRAVWEMERQGVRIDQDGLETMLEDERAKREDALVTIAKISGFKHVVPKADAAKKEWAKDDILNLASHAQVKGTFRAIDYPIPNTQAITFYKLIADGESDPNAKVLAQAILTYKKTTKTISTYLEAWKRDMTEAGFIHPSFNTLGADTGRFSSSQPNFQNITKKGGLRNLMIPDEGYSFVVADYEQMELRVFAHFAEDERMRAAFLSGDDLYQQVSDLLGVPRDVGKMITLASQYGAGWAKTKEQAIEFAFKLGNEDQVPTLMAYDWRAMHERFHKNYKVRDLQYRTEGIAQKRGAFGDPYILTVGGRRQRPKRVLIEKNGRKTLISIFKDLGNSLIQGSCSDIMKESIIAAWERGLDLRLTVHDELVAHVRDKDVDWAKEVLLEVMTRTEYVPPLTVEAGSGKSYGDAK